MPRDWGRAFRQWQRFNAPHKTAVGDLAVPEPRTEYLLYQTLLGAWPPGGRRGPDWAGFPGRIAAYMEKAVREAKVHTAWQDPNPAYESALRAFVERVLAPGNHNPFPAALEAFLAPLARAGYCNSLAQTLLKVACPGVPDIYQGTELWDFSLVDPDNRRPVDFQRRQALLGALRGARLAPAALAARLLRRPEDGRIKLFVLQRALALRRARPALFTHGDYRPLAIAGEKTHHALAFARTGDGQALLAASGRLFLGLLGEGAPAWRPPVGEEVWGDTAIEASGQLPPGLYRDALTGRRMRPAGEAGTLRFPLARVFSHLPLALLEHVA
jgi:(1->4)-alpha-D-glucan 1-alpha-D-glucosylmutase